jgi:chorismate mutase
MEFFGIESKLKIIAGPCSAETQEQLFKTAESLYSINSDIVFRAGIWKPRSRPGAFKGVGNDGLQWLTEVQNKIGLTVATEVAEPEHVESVVKAGIKIVWIGARTASNPFSVQKLADALSGSGLSVMIKNPQYPDVDLWTGNIERILNCGITDVAAIHRGFYPFEKSALRNTPRWEVPIELKRRMPELLMICDPSHIAGKRQYIKDIAQRALDLNFDGLMIETHFKPSSALSDKNQQLNIDDFNQLISELKWREYIAADESFKQQLDDIREKIDVIDFQLLELLEHRMRYVKEIGWHKKQHNVSVLQLKRWGRILESRLEQARQAGLSEQFVKHLLELIHKESISTQTEILKSDEPMGNNENKNE